MRRVNTGVITLLCIGLFVNVMAQDGALDIPEAIDNPQLQRGQEWYNTALAFSGQDEPDSSYYYFNKAKVFFNKSAYWRGVALCLEQQAELDYDAYRIAAMKRTADSSYHLFLELNDTLKAGRLAKELGLAVELEGEYVEALHHYRESHRLAQSCGDSIGMASALNNSGLVYQAIDDDETARAYLRQALELALAVDDRLSIIGFELNLGNTYDEPAVLDSALFYYQSVMEHSKEDAEFSGYHKAALCNISNIHLLRKEYDVALDYAEQAMNFDADVDPTWQIVTLFNVAESYFGLEEYDESFPYLSEACQRSEGMNYLEGIINCKELMARYYKAQGEFDLAYEYLEDHHTLQDSLLGAEINHQLQVIKARDQLANLNQEIASLEEQQAEAEMAFKRKRNSILIIGGSLLLLLASFFYYYRSRTRVRLAMDEKMLAESKLDVLRSQMNPKFIYNAYGSTLQFFLNMGEREVYDYLSKFGALLRAFIGASSQTYIHLDREVNFLQTYLDLEKIRLSGELSFHIEVDPDLLERNPQLPSMMIHPFVESAVRQRREQPEQQGELLIEFTPSSDTLLCCRIKDHALAPALVLPDGVEAAAKDEKISSAFENGRERLQFLRKIGYPSADLKVQDFEDEQGNKGTEFLLYLPFLKEENA